MSIFTVYFCGTGSTKYDNNNKSYWDGELISTLANNSTGHEFAEWTIVDGPGSGNLQADDMFEKIKEYELRGTLFGKGWEENVKHAIHMIKGSFNWHRTELTEANYKVLKNAGIPIEEVQTTGSFLWRKYNYGNRKPTPQELQQAIIKLYRKGGPIPTQVNLVGWSRGGISCHMLANAMLADSQLKHIKVNIFAVDPVPGILNFQGEKVSLGSNVSEYVAFYAKDERSKGFACVIPTTHSSTKVHVYPMAGRHATLVGNAAANGSEGAKALPEPGRIVRHFAETCLTRWGVQLSKKLNLSTAEIARFHESFEQNEGKYIAMRKESYTKITEGDSEQRAVSFGNKGVPFKAIAGAQYQPELGLAAGLVMTESTYKHIR
ncbi:MAG: hypothetical protein JWR17_2020 [Pseudomonas sp.]|jgi:hypothetical protein|uniref:hypothetical protein n=1 Tax=Pseudomonas sp. TaxID=306 RepID=UPI002621416B|nr:hypothetical protein [Pseudomonas sp.]MDB6049274.1 hypothetical protein [Pseudomonas sp.]